MVTGITQVTPTSCSLRLALFSELAVLTRCCLDIHNTGAQDSCKLAARTHDIACVSAAYAFRVQQDVVLIR